MLPKRGVLQCPLLLTRKTTVNLGRIGGCDAVVKALKAFGGTDKDVAIHGCAVVYTLAFNTENRRELGRVGGCDAVVQALRAFGGTDKNVALNGCAAVINLAYNDAENKRVLLAAGATTALKASLECGYTSQALKILN